MNTWHKTTAGIALLTGSFYFLIHQKIIVIAIHNPSYISTHTGIAASKKKSNLFFYKDYSWHKETVELVWPNNSQEALGYICNRWLSVAAEEDIVHKKITAPHAFITQAGKGYISFDQNPFEPDQSTQEKFFLIEGLLRSIKATGLPLSGIYFLVNTKPLKDYHLDFSLAWSLDSYPVEPR